MNIKNFKNTIGGAILGISLLVGIGFMSATTAQAQYRNDDYYRQQREWQREQLRRQRQWEREQRRRNRSNDRWDRDDNRWGGSFDLRQTALNAGYNEGIKEGRNDRNRGERFEFRDESDYRSASKDYNSRFGNRGLYQAYFRQGFQNGYSDGYRGY
jgi:hypothetical protein